MSSSLWTSALATAGIAHADNASLTISPPADVTVAATGPCGQTYWAQVSYSFKI